MIPTKDGWKREHSLSFKRFKATNRELFKKIHFDDDLHSFDKRLQALKDFRTARLLSVGTGVMIGLPNQETYEDLVNDSLYFKKMILIWSKIQPYFLAKELPLGQS